MFGDQLGDSRSEETHLGPLAVNERIFIRRNRARRAARHRRWGVVEGSRIRREYPITLGRIEGHGKRGKALTADYVLEYRNTKLAVVEAKAWDKPLTEGVAQAKKYAAKLSMRHT